jgi:hypothetical protein
MIMALNIHYSRASDILIPDRLTTNPTVPLSAYRDSLGELVHPPNGAQRPADNIERNGR